jgi:hypothetical protein
MKYLIALILAGSVLIFTPGSFASTDQLAGRDVFKSDI